MGGFFFGHMLFCKLFWRRAPQCINFEKQRRRDEEGKKEERKEQGKKEGRKTDRKEGAKKRSKE